MQKSEGGALGMGGGPSNFMSARGTGDLLTRITWILFGVFLVISITLTLIDDGMAFNPLTHPTPPLPPDDQERPLGGLGLQLVRALVADARYARESERNHLTLVLPRNPSP